MLHKNAKIIAPETFSLIQQLQTLRELEGFHLVGGTALALQIGHRNSIDIDLFTQKDFDAAFLMDFIRKQYLFDEKFSRKNTVIGYFEIKYPTINPLIPLKAVN